MPLNRDAPRRAHHVTSRSPTGSLVRQNPCVLRPGCGCEVNGLMAAVCENVSTPPCPCCFPLLAGTVSNLSKLGGSGATACCLVALWSSSTTARVAGVSSNIMAYASRSRVAPSRAPAGFVARFSGLGSNALDGGRGVGKGRSLIGSSSSVINCVGIGSRYSMAFWSDENCYFETRNNTKSSVEGTVVGVD